jgi:hypothetical protein
MGRRWTAERVSAFFAVTVSLITLVVLAVQTRLMQKQARAAVWPYVELGFSANAQGFAWVVANKGVGPALVQRVRVAVDGKPQADWQAVIKALQLPDVEAAFAQSQLSETVLTPAEKTTEFYEFMRLGPGAGAKAMLASIDRLTITLCYCSIYDDCWITKFRESSRPAVDQCPADDVAFDN